MRFEFVLALLLVASCNAFHEYDEDIEIAGGESEAIAVVHRFLSEPNNWVTVSQGSIRSLHLSQLFIIFPHEPVSFDKVVWKNVMAVGLKKEVPGAEILFVDRFHNTGFTAIDKFYEMLPRNVRAKNIHCIGVGTGSDLCILLGKRFVDETEEPLWRLTGLDPLGDIGRNLIGDSVDYAMPVEDIHFVDVSSFVDVYHTSLLGTKDLVGDIDVFVNSAILQPECLPVQVADEMVRACEQFQVPCPPLGRLEKCSFNDYCPHSLVHDLEDIVDSAPEYSAKDRYYMRDFYELFRPSMERAPLLFSSALQPYHNCPISTPELDVRICNCDEELLGEDYRLCPETCEKFQRAGLRLNANVNGTFHLNTHGWWPYLSCVAEGKVPAYDFPKSVEEYDEYY